MKLKKVSIKNFKSVGDIDIEFDPSCRVLVGINESGKSNILRALSFLAENSKIVKKDDLREPLPDESPIEDAYVRFIFRFEKQDSDKLSELVTAKIASQLKNPDIIFIGKKFLRIKEYCKLQDEGLYKVDIAEESRTLLYWTLDEKYQLLSGWKKPSSTCPRDFGMELEGNTYKVAQYKLIKGDDFKNVPENYLEDATIDDLNSLIGNSIIEISKENIPKVVFWDYDEKNLLPASVKIEKFSSSPSTCIPLNNMFFLAGIQDIKSSIESAKKGTPNQFQNYLDRIAKATTKHFRSVWKDYKIEFSLRLNSDEIIPGIKEVNVHDFARRSDGFKRFVTFLLMISVNVKTETLRDTLLLIDEPDISLHPSGSRYLRDELIRISKTNYVIYSTHSIFMIDSGNINRHYIVKKKNEITTVESAQDSNIADEEVLYNALGHSVFAILKEKNIIFEGWKDKHLFLLALSKASSQLKEKFKEVGFCHAKGSGSIKTITPMIELAGRQCLIISDNDKAAIQEKKSYVQEKGFGEWKTYSDIDANINAITGEDFIKNDFIVKQVQLILKEKSMPEFSRNILPVKGKLSVLFRWFTENGMSKEQAEHTVGEVKNALFENLQYKDIIEEEYNKLLVGVHL